MKAYPPSQRDDARDNRDPPMRTVKEAEADSKLRLGQIALAT